MHQLKPVIRQHTALEQVGKRTVQAIQHGFWIVGTEQAAVAPQGFYRIHIGAALAAFGVAAVGVLDGVGAAAAVADRQRVLRVFDVPGGALHAPFADRLPVGAPADTVSQLERGEVEFVERAVIPLFAAAIDDPLIQPHARLAQAAGRIPANAQAGTILVLWIDFQRFDWIRVLLSTGTTDHVCMQRAVLPEQVGRLLADGAQRPQVEGGEGELVRHILLGDREI